MPNELKWVPRGCASGWRKLVGRAVVGPEFGTTFDVAVIWDEERYKMWFSWRPLRSIAYTESTDAVHWTRPRVVLTGVFGSPWEGDEVNRPTVVKKDGVYHMWYTGQMFTKENQMARSCIGYAVSTDGIHWERRKRPVLQPETAWEKYCTMCPHVLWDEEAKRYKMWYSAGEMAESDAIGYAESNDGIVWTKHPANPVFVPTDENQWEVTKVQACYVLKRNDGWYYMFYLGIGDTYYAFCSLARSRDGIGGWERHPDNPIVAGDDGMWDFGSVCKVCVLEEADRYIMFYNGVNAGGEQLGVAEHPGKDLFPADLDNHIPERGQPVGYKAVTNYYYHQYNFADRLVEFSAPEGKDVSQCPRL